MTKLPVGNSHPWWGVATLSIDSNFKTRRQCPVRLREKFITNYEWQSWVLGPPPTPHSYISAVSDWRLVYNYVRVACQNQKKISRFWYAPFSYPVMPGSLLVTALAASHSVNLSKKHTHALTHTYSHHISSQVKLVMVGVGFYYDMCIWSCEMDWVINTETVRL